MIVKNRVYSPLNSLRRLGQILWILYKNKLLFIFLRIFFYKRNKHIKHDFALRLRLALDELGPLFIKFGQLLSTRSDIVSYDLAKELSNLQDNVSSFSGEQAIQIVQDVFSKPISQIFKKFSVVPLASASISQVHEAVLDSGEEVIVKILKPDIILKFNNDLSLLKLMVKLFNRWFNYKHFSLEEVILELEEIINQETDLVREASNAEQLKRNFLNSSIVYIPKIYWDYVSKNVLVAEKINAISIKDSSKIKSYGTPLSILAERIVEIFFTQVFRDGFFHADMHPGNILVDVSTPYEPCCVLVDFGIMGILNDQDQYYLAANLLAFFKRDYRRIAALHLESGWVPAETRVEHFEASIRAVCEPIFAQSMHKVSCGDLLFRLLQTARDYKMKVQPQLLLLQKTLINIEGLSRQLYPEINIFEVARPLVETWLKKQLGLQGAWSKFCEELPFISAKMPEIPRLLYSYLKNLQKFD